MGSNDAAVRACVRYGAGVLWSAYSAAVVTGMAVWPLLQRYLKSDLSSG